MAKAAGLGATGARRRERSTGRRVRRARRQPSTCGQAHQSTFYTVVTHTVARKRSSLPTISDRSRFGQENADDLPGVLRRLCRRRRLAGLRIVLSEQSFAASADQRRERTSRHQHLRSLRHLSEVTACARDVSVVVTLVAVLIAIGLRGRAVVRGIVRAVRVVNSPGGPEAPPTSLVKVKVTVTVPAQTARAFPNTFGEHRVGRDRLSSVNGKGVTGVNPTTSIRSEGARLQSRNDSSAARRLRVHPARRLCRDDLFGNGAPATCSRRARCRRRSIPAGAASDSEPALALARRSHRIA